MALLLLVCASGMWVIDYIRMPELWGTILGSQLLTLFSGLLLCMTLYRAKVSEDFSLLPAVLYVAAVGVLPNLREHWEPQLIAAILLLFLHATAMHNGSVGARRYMVHTDAVAGSAAARHVHTAYDSCIATGNYTGRHILRNLAIL